MYADRPGTAVTPFVRDDGHRATRTTPVALPAGAGRWTTVTRTVPEADPVGALGLGASPGSGAVTLDGLTWSAA
ncbi:MULTISPECIES: hypothetical protein [unclassified Streptomyces]|uniref:hypothetical protein n=1 Tax=unclassified Streptomyces TaxID=2593676 RepID=UPI000A6F3CD7|nr:MULTISPECIES: hypothetical protein [unclassified Streptomyces]